MEHILCCLHNALGSLKQPQSLQSLSAEGWTHLIDLSFDQGVDAISVDGYHKWLDSNEKGVENCLLETDESLEDLKFEWFGSVLQAEEDFKRQKEAISSITKTYSDAGIKTMILKGYGLSQYYPIPKHRPTGDIDIYLFGDWKKGDEIIRKMGIKVDEGHEHHTTFQWMDFAVENHYDFINTKAHRDARKIEARLKELATEKLAIRNEKLGIYTPSPDFNVIFLIRHLGQHFAGERIILRQVLDWGLFLDHEARNIHWDKAVPFLKEMGIWTFFNQINAICRDNLGLKLDGIPEIERNEELEKRILEDILSPEFSETKPSGLFPVLAFKARRWWHNRWKHPLVYDEWWLPMLLTLAWSHLRRIKTIKD